MSYIRSRVDKVRQKVRKLIRRIQVEKTRLVPLEEYSDSGNERVIVSLTSYGNRLKYVERSIRSILLQTVHPDAVVLYLDAGTDPSSLPSELIELQRYGLIIKAGYENLRPHTKYYYAMKEYPNEIIITIDDDALYPADTIETLLRSYENYPHAVSARRVHRILYSDEGILAPYNDWAWEWKEQQPVPRNSLFATGVGGVLYPPALIDVNTFDMDILKTIALENDDIWLKMFEAQHDIRTVWASNVQVLPDLIRATQVEGTLNSSNVHQSNNDRIIENLIRALKLRADLFVD